MVFSIIPWRPKGLPILTPRSTGGFTIEGRVCAILRDGYGVTQDVFETKNTVTDNGDLFYSYMASYCVAPSTTVVPDNLFTDNATPSLFDGVMELYSGVTVAPSKSADRSGLTNGTVAPSSEKAMDSGYPKRNDTDTDNTGKGTDVITYKVSYTTAQANATGIDDVVITNPSPGASENLLMWADGLGSFTKTSSDTLVVYVNHTMNGS